VNASQRYARVVSVLLAAAIASGNLQAQSGGNTQPPLRPGQTKGPSFLVPVFKSAGDRTLGVQQADVVRDRLMSDNMITQIYVVPKNDIDTNLESSGYSKTEALTSNDLKMLAGLLKADEYLDGTVSRDEAGGITLQVFLNLVRPRGMIQPLPTITGTNPRDAAAKLSREISQARRQIPHASKCLLDWRQQKVDDAMSAAQRGIREYPNAIFPRVCQLEMANERKWGPDSLIKYAEEILAIHPENPTALLLVVDAYGAKDMEEKYLSTLTKLLAADPTDARLQVAVVNALGAAGKPEVAKPIIDEAVKQNPGDPALIRLQFQIYRALRDWKGVVRIGEEMMRTDTAAADTAFFQMLVSAYVTDSQLPKAAEAAARGAQKFQSNPQLWMMYAQLARQTGQIPQALEAINRVLGIDPKYPGANLQKAQIYSELDQVDSLVAALRVAVANGADKQLASGMALTKGNQIFQAYSRDSSKTVERGEYVLSVLAFADSLHSSDNTVFLMGVTELYIGQAILTQLQQTRSCDEAKRADALLIDAQQKIGKAGRAFPDAAQGAMQGAMQLQGFASQATKAYCRS
jgi:tetratricopeptide (TPR) repeat protein